MHFREVESHQRTRCLTGQIIFPDLKHRACSNSPRGPEPELAAFAISPFHLVEWAALYG
jgi:hypothetical protein